MKKVINIPAACLASDDNVLQMQRQKLKEALVSGKKVVISAVDGNVLNDPSTRGMMIPAGKLAYQWYESDPMLLEAEKSAMSKYYPNFKLDKLDDGRLYWLGELSPGIFKSKYGIPKKYMVMAVYNNNHPHQQMGSSGRVYLVNPDMNDIIRERGYTPAHVLHDSSNNEYLCTNRADNVRTGEVSTTAASVLAWAVKWLSCYELTLTGEMSISEFNSHLA